MSAWKVLEKQIETFCTMLILFAAWIVVIAPGVADPPAQKAFHIIFTNYEKDSKDGSYTFHIRFEDLENAIPHVNWHPESKPVDAYDKSFGVGDMIGKYKITNFTISIEPATGEMFSPQDMSELTLEDPNKLGDKFELRFRPRCNCPGLGDSYNPK